jgi:hypothetical protein
MLDAAIRRPGQVEVHGYAVTAASREECVMPTGLTVWDDRMRTQGQAVAGLAGYGITAVGTRLRSVRAAQRDDGAKGWEFAW